MRATELGMEGAWVFEPPVFPDERGTFAAPFQADVFRRALGFDLTVGQVNQSVSRRGVIRGLHFADVPPGQSKYVYCSHGALLDVIVDVRVGSPTFRTVEVIELDDARGRAVYLAEGLGHAFVALTGQTCMTYLCSTPFNPNAEHCLDPLDPALAVPLPDGIPTILSEKDRAAPTLAEACDSGILPSWDRCRRRYEELRCR